MQISTGIYTFKQGVKNIWRNKMFSLASIATMSACIFLFGLFFCIVTNFRAMVRGAEEGVAVTVFFEDDISYDQIQAIGDKIRQRSEVKKFNFISADEAWENFKKEYFNGDEEAAEGFADDNPLAHSASYEIYMNDISQQDSLVKYLEGLEGVQKVNKSEVVANTLSDLNSLIGYISMGIILILFGVSVFLISNTVMVGISVRREEIAIMKLIGATDFFVRAPFMVEGILIGFIGAALPMILLYFVYQKIIVYVTGKFMFLQELLQFISAGELFRTLVPISLILGVGIGFFGSYITIRKHLRV
ncbi:MAG: permease-like cell division protein FtsX [Lachnospiraceae bacterium]